MNIESTLSTENRECSVIIQVREALETGDAEVFQKLATAYYHLHPQAGDKGQWGDVH